MEPPLFKVQCICSYMYMYDIVLLCSVYMYVACLLKLYLKIASLLAVSKKLQTKSEVSFPADG